MAGINLLDQLKGKKAGAAPAASKASFKPSLSSGSGGLGDNLGIVLLLFFYVLVGGAGHFFLQRHQETKMDELQQELSQLEGGITKENRKKSQMRNIGEEMRGYQARMDELQGKLKAVSQQETDRSYLIRALEYAATEMPKEVWLTEISAVTNVNSKNSGSNSGDSASATFKGYAINAQAVSDFIQKLEASVYFPSTTLDRLEVVPGNEISAPSTGVISVPPNSRKFQIMAKLGE